jgi:phage terminase large subunit GpA-like protein
VLLADEIDSNNDEAGEEGDAVDLLFKRGESYPSVVQAVSSTPTMEGTSKIWNWFEQSDQRFWFVPCPHCGTWGIFKWSHQSIIKAGPCFFVERPEGKPEAATLVCATCAKEVNDKQRLEAYRLGEWRATAPFNGIRGFHLNWIYCPWPAKKGYRDRLHQMAVEWERAKKKGANNLKVIVNTGLCETWKLKLEAAPDWQALFNRRQPYGEKLPEGVIYLTCSVDTQSDRLEYEVQGWGIGEECWGIETGKIFGNPHLSDVWHKLDEKLKQTWQHPLGAQLRISCTLIDSGGQTDNKAFAKPVYAFVRRRQGRYVFACKGSSELGSPLVLGRLQKNGIMLQSVGTDVCKSMIYERLTIATPGPGFCHFPEGNGYDEEYFQQLTSEGVNLVKGKRQWVKTRARNEALDLRVYGHAAFEIRNVNLEAVARSIVAPNNLTKPPAQPPSEPQKIELKPSNPPPRPSGFHRFRRIIDIKN